MSKALGQETLVYSSQRLSTCELVSHACLHYLMETSETPCEVSGTLLALKVLFIGDGARTQPWASFFRKV